MLAADGTRPPVTGRPAYEEVTEARLTAVTHELRLLSAGAATELGLLRQSSLRRSTGGSPSLQMDG